MADEVFFPVGALFTSEELSLASCAQTDPEAFFPGKGESNKMAKRVCAGCDLRLRCLEVALEQEQEVEGIWGGLSRHERRRLRRKAA